MDIKIKMKKHNTKPIEINKKVIKPIHIDSFVDLYFKIKISPETFKSIINENK